MGRSQESFSKKEREKKREKKKKEKLAKREGRKQNSEQGKSFDDMIAYVDEFGNITDTPPDPDEKSVVKAEDIEVSVSKKEEEEEMTGRREGKVSFFNSSKGFGFIIDKISNERVFFHVNDTIDVIDENDRVVYDIEKGPKGMNACRVKLA